MGQRPDGIIQPVLGSPRILWIALGLGFLLAWTINPALAQEDDTPPPRSQTALPIQLENIPTLLIHKSGGWEYLDPRTNTSQAGGVAGIPACGAITYTDPNNFVAETPVELAIQTGFEEDEIAYASFVLDPSLFPIRLESFEMVFAQQTTVQTVTHWSVLLWDGPPSVRLGGINIDLGISSNDIEFLHLRMDAGTQATNIKVVVDPDDPIQVDIFNDSGTNMFTIGYRIDQHNNPSGELSCLVPPDSSSNAFPATDINGIANLDNNWLDALFCENDCDGLNSFLTLPSTCTPGGDWIIRATFSCTLIGACCDVDGICAEHVSDSTCLQQGGTFMGSNTTCANVTCAEPIGACCLDGVCLNPTSQPICSGISGVYMGNGTTCDQVDCTTGACCFANGNCLEMVEIGCADFGGTFQGGATCDMANCPQPLGSCCIDGFCLTGQERVTCEMLGTWNGIDSVCGIPDPCATLVCPTASTVIPSPQNGTVDARQPYAPTSLLPRQGIGSADDPIILDLNVDDAEAGCFSLCESISDPSLGLNTISLITPLSGGLYELVLDHPITAGATTTIRYDGHPDSTSYIAHPGNTNGDMTVDASDIALLIAAMQGLTMPPYSFYSLDMDHSDAIGPGDLLRLIDLMNGAGVLETWQGVAKSPATCP